ncbi:MAG: sigma-70 family RNA polymerase sigma factor [Clostridia bacterium]|nr:sigma-70 family RNA polymerase sigma factor [Clostridia bacterium]
MIDNIDKQYARDALIEHNLRLVVYIAKRFENTGAGIEELVSIGTVGLIKAITTFNKDKNIKLATYASRCIENEILMFIRKTSVHKREVSIDEPLSIDWDGNELLLSDILGSEVDSVSRRMEDDEERRIIREAVSGLDARERVIIEMRFGLNGNKELTQKEVADILGISQSYISRLEKKIMVELRKKIEEKI